MNINFISKFNFGDFSIDEDTQPIIIDSGGDTIKAGFGGEDFPRIIFPTVIGRERSGSPFAYLSLQWKGSPITWCVGEEIKSYIGKIRLIYPIQNGIITNWDDMEKIWNHIFYNELRVAPEEHPVLLTENPLNPKINREKIIQIMFETFSVPYFYLANQSVLSLYQSAKTSGIVIEIGHSASYVVPVYENFALNHFVTKSNLSGKNINEYLIKMLNEKGYSFSSYNQREIIKDIKEKICYVAFDFDEEIEISNQKKSFFQKDYEVNDENFFQMYDKKVIEIGNERFKCSECLFKPSLIESDEKGIHNMIYDSIMKCNQEIQKDLLQNIVLSGGTTMIQGIEERIHKEINKLLPFDTNLEIISSPERQYSSWIGGSILSTFPNFETNCISQEEYDEIGPIMVNRKCF
ncbi:actin-10-related [Anaeramoeba ignava]|uniref:Actin-10-related n=1 Tax=Anaeramoeba ignava TaxID=1746090 RepID=A0A9Q0LF26_ANAIG|nr:actin-10-related [Anaeramoeba ignava]